MADSRRLHLFAPLRGRFLGAIKLPAVRQRSVSRFGQIVALELSMIRHLHISAILLSAAMFLPADTLAPAATCNASLWSRVYNPARLQKVNSCLTVNGVVTESSADDDGDQHFLLKLDPGQDQLLKKKNTTKKNGELVAEIVCANRATLKKAKATCKGYSNQIGLPAIGAHVKVTGTYVIDTHNGWAEIHPVSRIESIG